MMPTSSRLATPLIAALSLVGLLGLAPGARAQGGETITATAQVTRGDGVTSTAEVSVVVDQFSSDSDRDAITAALKSGGTEGVRRLLLVRPSMGSLKVGTSSTVIKYVYARPTPTGRLITVVTGSPIGFVGAGTPGGTQSGSYLGLVILEVMSSGPGHGELVPAAKVRLDDQGAVVTEDYGGTDVVKLTNVIKK